MGDVEISLPKLPEPIPFAGFKLVGYEVMFTGCGEQLGKGPELATACTQLARELSDRFKVYALASGKEDANQTYDDAMICEWMPRANNFAGGWGKWEYA